jgi:hypothetical protein
VIATKMTNRNKITHPTAFASGYVQRMQPEQRGSVVRSDIARSRRNERREAREHRHEQRRGHAHRTSIA